MLLYAVLLPFNVQTYLLYSVEFLYFKCWKDELWLDLNCWSVKPIYVFHRHWLLLLHWHGRLRHFLGICRLGTFGLVLTIAASDWLLRCCVQLFIFVNCDCWARIVHTWITHPLKTICNKNSLRCDVLKVSCMIFKNFFINL